MKVTVRLFAGIREAAGATRIEVEVVDGATVGEVRAALRAAAPALAERLGYCRTALDDDFVADDAPVPPGAVVDIIPPVSGG